jgi:protein arginine kinase
MLLASRTSFLQNLAANENLSKAEIDRLRAQHMRRIIEEHQVSLEE